jgi:hypothetical protein
MIAQADASLGPERQVMVGEIMSHLQQQAAAVPLFAYQFVYAAASGPEVAPAAGRRHPRVRDELEGIDGAT